MDYRGGANSPSAISPAQFLRTGVSTPEDAVVGYLLKNYDSDVNKLQMAVRAFDRDEVEKRANELRQYVEGHRDALVNLVQLAKIQAGMPGGVNPELKTAAEKAKSLLSRNYLDLPAAPGQQGATPGASTPGLSVRDVLYGNDKRVIQRTARGLQSSLGIGETAAYLAANPMDNPMHGFFSMLAKEASSKLNPNAERPKNRPIGNSPSAAMDLFADHYVGASKEDGVTPQLLNGFYTGVYDILGSGISKGQLGDLWQQYKAERERAGDRFSQSEFFKNLRDAVSGLAPSETRTIAGPDYLDAVAVPVPGATDSHEKVQLWEGGPYWATTNIGAENPEDYGYYFWWGDTVGYKREGNAWVATDGSSANFSFGSSNTPTYNKSIATLQSEGWIVSQNGTNVLAPEHDAAQVQWGGGWRMPTYQELDDLCYNKCDWTWTTQNGVNGYIVRGRGDYASNSIFLPCAGYGDGTSLLNSGSDGYYWSSVPYSDDYNARFLSFGSGYHYVDYRDRSYGQSVRPVQGFAK